MPHYVFVCQSCKKEFEKILSMSAREAGGVKCPECGSDKVEQRLAAFSAVTSKKS